MPSNMWTYKSGGEESSPSWRHGLGSQEHAGHGWDPGLGEALLWSLNRGSKEKNLSKPLGAISIRQDKQRKKMKGRNWQGAGKGKEL